MICIAFARRDLKIKYNRFSLGLTWTILQPLMYLIAFSILFQYVLPIESDYPYVLFVFPGILCWTLFNYIFAQAGSSLIQSQDLVKKLQFPRALLPLSKSITGLFDFSIGFLFLPILHLIYQYPISLKVLLIPVPITCLVCFALALGVFMSRLTVINRDLQNVIPFLIGLSIWLTPVFFPVSIVPEPFKDLIYLNPITGCLEALRWMISPELGHLNLIVILGLIACPLFLLISLFSFQSIEYKITDAL